MCVRDVEGFAALRAQWQSLLNRSQPNHVFMTWEWLFTWWEHFGQGQELFILVVEDEGEVVGILPLMLCIQEGGYMNKERRLHFIGYRLRRWNDWMDIIAIRKEEVIQASLEYLLERQYMWDFLDLWDVPEDSDTIGILSDLARQLGFPVQKKSISTCPYLPTTSDWQSYYSSFRSMRTTGDPERQVRRLSARGELKMHWAEDSDLMVNLEALFDLHQRRQPMRHKSSRFSQEVYRKFYCALVHVFPRNWLDCSALTLNGEVIAAHFGFRYNHKFYWCTPAFDPDYAAFSPGKVFLKAIIETCFADDEILEFDFLVGKEPYKYEWTTLERHGYCIQVGNTYMSGLVGKIVRRMPLYARRSLMNGRSYALGLRAQ
jgi:CelD/BcsL family acetyltransferase involved in cellulose biosynthesis